VGAFATYTLLADSAALASGSATNDRQYREEQRTLLHLASARDKLAAEMKIVLAQATHGSRPSHGRVTSELARGRALLHQAAELAADNN
jgi:pyruvate/2-oxoglutarate dehydrogenase complex dihydrolipoamide acyltransferase (E2) component